MVALKWICVAIGATVVLWDAATRDIRYSGEYMGDLRNRVVGARIIEDGGSPYFYKWKPGDPLRYYDPQAFDIYIPSISTSTPFLHRLLIPLAGLPFATIMRVWMGVLYLLYFCTAYPIKLQNYDWISRQKISRANKFHARMKFAPELI